MPRIVSGMARGINLNVPPGLEVRPTLEKVRGALFNMLGPLDGTIIVDLCAGSGSLGCEALSRGAAEVAFFEQDRSFARNLEENIAQVLKSIKHYPGNDTEPSTRVYALDARQAPVHLTALRGKVDVILADPPYRTAEGGHWAEQLLRSRELADLMAPDGIMAVESAVGLTTDIEGELCWRLIKSKNYGAGTELSFWRTDI